MVSPLEDINNYNVIVFPCNALSQSATLVTRRVLHVYGVHLIILQNFKSGKEAQFPWNYTTSKGKW